MSSSVFEINSAHGSARLYDERCVFYSHTDNGAQRKRTVFLRDIISVELTGDELILGTACGGSHFCFDSANDASLFEEELVCRISSAKGVAASKPSSAEEKMRIGEDEFAAALFGDDLYEAPKNSAESPADFIARLNDADIDEIISVLHNGRDGFTDEELERIEAALVLKTEM